MIRRIARAVAYVAVGAVVAGLLIAFSIFAHCAKLGVDRRVVARELAYLDDFADVAWCRVEGTTITLAFQRAPDDWERMMRGAAWRAYRATNRRWLVVAIDMRVAGADGQPHVLGSILACPPRHIGADRPYR